MSMSYSPPPTPPPPAGVEGETGQAWERLRKAWNAAWGDKRQWRSIEPPPEFLARLSEPGAAAWLDEAIAGIPEIKKGACAGFKTPPTLRQYCDRTDKGTFLARMLGGEFTDAARGVPAKQREAVA